MKPLTHLYRQPIHSPYVLDQIKLVQENQAQACAVRVIELLRGNRPLLRLFFAPLVLLTSSALMLDAGVTFAQMPGWQGGARPMMQPQYAPQGSSTSLQLNDSGGAVANLQHTLAELGYYNGSVTGYFDGATQAAVSQFQQENGLPSDGVVGIATEEVLYQGGRTPSALSAQSASSYGDSFYSQSSQNFSQVENGNQIVDLQTRLTELGYYNGSASGLYDSETQAAIIRFQQDNGLAADGIVGRATGAALWGARDGLPGQAGQAASTPVPSPNDGALNLGDSGSEVSDLQIRLQELGYYNGPISGSFGSQTEAALIAFQEAQGLTPDGIAGSQVASALSAAIVPDASQTTTASASTSGSSTTSASTSGVSSQAGTIAPSTTPSSSGQTTVGQTTSVQPTAVNSTTQTGTTAQAGSTTTQTDAQIQQALLDAEQARKEAEQARLEAEQARAVLFQNFEDGRFSVVELQRRLRLQGFNPGDINGILDNDTQTAIAEAQRSYGLSETDLFNQSF